MQEPSGSRSKRIPSAFESFGGETQLCASFDKSAPPRTLPVVHTAPWPHALWSICGSNFGILPEVEPVGKPQTHVRHLSPSLFVRVGWPYGPTSSIKRSLRSRPNQVSRQDPAGQQSWTCVCPTRASSRHAPSSYRTHPSCPTAYSANMARPLATALWLRPSSSSPTLGDVQSPLWYALLPRTYRSSPPE